MYIHITINMIRAVVFDLGGTLVDKYSLSPLVNLRKAFRTHNIRLSDSIIAKDMGMKKFDHITHLSYESVFRDQFLIGYGRPHTSLDLNDIYDTFCDYQDDYLRNNLELIPETVSAIPKLQDRDIKIGITTGFNKDQMELCLDLLGKYNIYPDSYVSSTCLDFVGRPDPQMIQENMRRLGITNPKEVLKVDDTCVGIEEGLNADCITVGVAKWSINMGVYNPSDKDKLDYEKYKGELEYDEYKSLYKTRLKDCRTKLHSAEPCYLINTLDDLENCLV